MGDNNEDMRLNMGQVTHGIRGLLAKPRLYAALQGLLDAKEGRARFSSRYIRSRDGDRVLDIGCGTATIRRYLSNVEYYGFDLSARYIDAAKNNLREVPGCTLVCAPVDKVALGSLPTFDIILALGVLHHLDDGEVNHLADLANAALAQGGRLITLDPCIVQGQSPVARFLIKRDRGLHVRDAEGYQSLMASRFNSIQTDIRHDLNRFPYTHFIMECSNK